MKRKMLGLLAALLLLVNAAGVQAATAAAAKVQLLPSNEYKELPYVNDNGKKVQLRGYKNFEVDWSSAEKDAWPVMLDLDRLLLLNGGYTKAISTTGGRKLWEQYYSDFDLVSLQAWGQSSKGTIFTIRKKILDDTVDARVDLITRDGKVKSTYYLPHDDYLFPDFTSAIGLDSNDNLITTLSGALVSLAPDGKLNWYNDDFVDWTVSSSSVGSFVFTMHETNIKELIVDAQNNVLVLTDLNHAYYLNNSGKLLWDAQLDSTPKDWSASGYIQKKRTVGPGVRQSDGAYGNFGLEQREADESEQADRGSVGYDPAQSGKWTILRGSESRNRPDRYDRQDDMGISAEIQRLLYGLDYAKRYQRQRLYSG
ncbi:hypothetical protein OMP38_09745 [Cohnella ginsengisoli]|uniref:Uncharacterized protein n=1 Tax=Cohnella ginsengisoli TaxID=425004 RepID=A0A9X4KFF5_9BACL|nr:hypothetical protein [Cohnella ginsengisoli]MDG0791123.1 hypothetical protein [Cohnella ginsengisoli]